MPSPFLSDKKMSKRDKYLLKFQKYREEKEKEKICHSKQILKKPENQKIQNVFHKAVPCSERKKIPGSKLTQQSTVSDAQLKENKRPLTKPLVTKSAVTNKQTIVNKTKSVRNSTQTLPFNRRAGSLSNPPKIQSKTSSSLNVRRSCGPGVPLSNTDEVKSRKLNVTSVDIGKSRKSLSNPSQQKCHDKKSTGRVVESRLFLNTNTRPGVANINANKRQTVQQKSRRHSELHKAPKNTKPASILKRKSCFASITCNDGVFGETVGKTPDHGRSVRFISPDVHDDTPVSNYRKTPKRPDGKSIPVRQLTPKHSAKKPRLAENQEQAVMRNKLDDWLKSKGRTPSKFRHLMCFHDHDQNKEKTDPNIDSCIKRSLTVEELTEQKARIDREDENIVVNLADQFRDSALEELDSMLEECTTLYEAGCPREDILSWLNSIEQNISLSKTYAKFYICKAHVLKSSENLENVLQVYEDAVVNGAQPASELATSLTGIVKEICQEREKKARRRSAADVQEDNIFESSAILYTVRQVTPFSKKRRKSSSDVKSSSPCTVVTPVRRSTRRSIAGLPSSLQDKTPTYKSLEDISDKDRKKTLFFPNEALN